LAKYRPPTRQMNMGAPFPRQVNTGSAGGPSIWPCRRAQTAQVKRVQTSASVQPDPLRTVQVSAQSELAQVDADLASELIASGVTTQPVETVIAVLAARRDGASINAAAKASGINYRTAQRIVEAAAERRQRGLAAVG
jgi:hypothetical protein